MINELVWGPQFMSRKYELREGLEVGWERLDVGFTYGHCATISFGRVWKWVEASGNWVGLSKRAGRCGGAMNQRPQSQPHRYCHRICAPAQRAILRLEHDQEHVLGRRVNGHGAKIGFGKVWKWVEASRVGFAC